MWKYNVTFTFIILQFNREVFIYLSNVFPTNDIIFNIVEMELLDF